MKIAVISLVSLVIYCHVGISGGKITETLTKPFQKFIDKIRGESADPDETRSTPEIIESRGFNYEIHNIPTKDGYTLKTFRIVNPDVKSGKTPAKRPIILQHGLISQSSYWLINSPFGFLHDDPEEQSSSVKFDGKGVGKNLGFELAKRGYDVWLPNLRGSVVNNPTKEEEEKFKKDHNGKSYWDFSFDEMVDYDLPAVIAYIQEKTGHKTVGYAGDSLGGSNMFLLLASHPEYNDIIKPFIALAPAANLGHLEMKIPVQYAAYLPQIFQNPLSKHEGQTLTVGHAGRLFATSVCATPGLRRICEITVNALMGHTNQLNMTRLPVYFSVFPGGASGKTLIHMGQQAKEGDNGVRKYNYESKEKNLEVYGTERPPLYEFEKITNRDIALFWSDNDAMASPKDIDVLKKRLTVPLKKDYHVDHPDFNHMAFMFGKDGDKLVNLPILQILADYDNYKRK